MTKRKLKLTGGGFGNFTGQMGVIYFQDGLSVNDVHPNDALRIAGTIGAVWEDGSAANVGDIYNLNIHASAPMGKDARKDPHTSAVYGGDAHEAIARSNEIARMQFRATGVQTPDIEPARKVEPSEEQESESEDAEVKTSLGYTRAELEALADEKGMAGLRELANTHGIKGTSIANLIDNLLKG